MTSQEIVDLYQKTQSIKKTAKEAKIGWQKVRKILITERKYPSAKAERIRTLANKGLSAFKIAEELGISYQSVNGYLPYSRAPLTSWDAEAPRSENAVRIHKCREKKERPT